MGVLFTPVSAADEEPPPESTTTTTTVPTTTTTTTVPTTTTTTTVPTTTTTTTVPTTTTTTTVPTTTTTTTVPTTTTTTTVPTTTTTTTTTTTVPTTTTTTTVPTTTTTTTPPSPPPLVPNVEATVDSTATMTVTWGAPAGDVIEYQVSISPTVDGFPTRVVTEEARSAVFSGLPSGDYTVQVRARNADGLSPAGIGDAFRIVVEPGAPRTVRGTKGVRETTITWDTPADNGGGTISSYEVTVAGVTQTVDAASPRSAVFTGLPLGKLTATVRARNAQGLSAPGVSPEFESVRPVDPFETTEAFARQAYRDLFDVNPSAAEVTALASRTAVDGANAPALMTEMMRSTRFDARRRVARLYFAYFGRVPDAAGQMYWTELMESGRLDLQGVSDEFARSAEFQNTYGGFNEAEFIVLVYNNVLGRIPDQPGFNYWLDERYRGLSRGGVMTWFTEGQEYITRSLAGVETSLAHIMLLDRSPTAGEYADWVNRMNNRTADLGTLSYDLYASDEYAARITP